MIVSRSARGGAKAASLTGAALALLGGAPALAQTATATLQPDPSLPSSQLPQPKVISPPPPDDGLQGGGFYMEADVLTQDNVSHRYTATGSVEARYNGKVLRAESVEYDEATGVVTARGHVQIIKIQLRPDTGVERHGGLRTRRLRYRRCDSAQAKFPPVHHFRTPLVCWRKR